jgi:hypothetical protein
MATYEELIERTALKVQDAALADIFGDLINQGVAEISGGMQSALGDWITPPLPDLFTIDTVDTDTANGFVAMPDTFQRDLQLAVKATGQEIDIANSFIEFTETYPLLNKSGTISEVVEHGGLLYYQGIPTVSETVTLHFYRAAVPMVDNNDIPDGIPLHLQIPLLTNFASWKAYEIIEDGLEGDNPNTQKFMGFFFSALKTLELSIPAYTRGLFLR